MHIGWLTITFAHPPCLDIMSHLFAFACLAACVAGEGHSTPACNGTSCTAGSILLQTHQESARAAATDTGRSGALVSQADPWAWLSGAAQDIGEGLSSAGNTLVGGFAKGAAKDATKDLSGPEGEMIKAEVDSWDVEEMGAHLTTAVREGLWDDVTSHTVEVCFLTMGKEGISAQFAKCNVGVSCSTCKHIKVEVRAGIDFCQGFKVHANAGFSALSPAVTGILDILDVFEMVVDKMPAEVVTTGLANTLAEGAMETIAENGGVSRYTLKVQVQYSFQYEVGNSQGATFDAKVGLDLCDSGWTCFGMEVSGSTGFKFGGKMFVCFSKTDGTIKIEIGAGPFTGILMLTYLKGLDTEFKLTPNNIGAHVVNTKVCMSKPEWRSTQQRGDDGLCAFVTQENKCQGSACYWAEPNERRKFCFATKSWKDKHPGQQDGWCPFSTTETDCINYLHCVWSVEPCESDNTCKGTERLAHDLQLLATQKVCMATPQHLSRTQTQSDGLCALVADENKCTQSSACYWSTRPKRRKGCFAITLWKKVHPGKGDGLCPFHTTAEKCKGVCAWTTHPCEQDPCGDDAKKFAQDYRVLIVR